MNTKRLEIVLLAVLILGYTTILSYFAILRHNAFASGYDLGNMDQTIWNTLHGRFFALTGNTGTVSRFSIHGDIFLVLLAPLYALWDNVRILLIAQSLFLGLGAIPVFLLSRKLLQNTFFAFIFVLMYLLNPGMQWTNIYDFHAVALAIPFLLFAFYFAYIKHWQWYFVFIVLAMMTKEEIPLSVSMLGIVIAIYFKNFRIGAITFISGLLWTGLMVEIIIPHFNMQHTYSYFTWYQLIESNITSTKFVNIPSVIFTNFFATPDALSYFSILLKEFAFLPIFGLPWIILALPDLLINTFSDHAQMRSIFFQYDSGVIPGLMIASIFGMYYLSLFFQKVRFTTKLTTSLITLLSLGVLTITNIITYRYSPLPINPSCWCVMYHVTDQDKQFASILGQIPVNASISTSPEIRPHITHRENAFTIPASVNTADYVALIDQNRLAYDYTPKDAGLIQAMQTNEKYTQISHIGHFYLFKRL